MNPLPPALAVALFAAPTFAAPFYSVSCSPGNVFPGGSSQSATSAQCHGGQLTDYFAGLPNNTQALTYEWDGVAYAGGTAIGTSANASLRARDLVNLGGPRAGASTTATLRFDDIVIQAPAGYADATVVTSFNVVLSGGVSASLLHVNGLFFGGPSITASARLELAGPGVRGTGDWIESKDPINSSSTLTGLLANGAGLITSPAFDAPIGTPFTIEIVFSSGTLVDYVLVGSGACPNNCTQTTMDGDSSFLSTVSLPTSFDVFNLPAGFQVGSASGAIVGNRAVPEPAAALSLAAAGVALGAWRVRPRRRG